MSLKQYHGKRDFRKTPEPDRSGKTGSAAGRAYAIQKHKASHLHYDLRLEEGGVLKSWAIPKEPPLKEGIRRLAVQTEDHPRGYEDFEGIIPEGEYGAGTVEIWDRGTHVPVEALPGKRVIEICGKRLKGLYCLIKLKPKEPDDMNWLFFKLKKA